MNELYQHDVDFAFKITMNEMDSQLGMMQRGLEFLRGNLHERGKGHPGGFNDAFVSVNLKGLQECLEKLNQCLGAYRATKIFQGMLEEQKRRDKMEKKR